MSTPEFRAPGLPPHLGPSGVLWNCEVTNPLWYPLDGADIVWMAAHPGVVVAAPFATATPETDEALLGPVTDASGYDDPALLAYFDACKASYGTVHAGTIAEPPVHVHGVTVYDGGVLVHDHRGWTVAEIDGEENTIRGVVRELRPLPTVHVAISHDDASPLYTGPDHVVILLSPEFGTLAAFRDWLRESKTLAATAQANTEPVEYLVQGGTKPRIFAVDSTNQTRTLRALLTCATTGDALAVAQALNVALGDSSATRQDILGVIEPLVSAGSLSAVQTELDRLGL